MGEPLKTYRTKNITISLPRPDTYSWIEFVLQELYIDSDTGENLQLVDEVERYNKRADLVYRDIVTYVEPLTGQTRQISVGGISRAIKSAIVKWVEEDGTKQYLPQYDMIVDKPPEAP